MQVFSQSTDHLMTSVPSPAPLGAVTRTAGASIIVDDSFPLHRPFASVASHVPRLLTLVRLIQKEAPHNQQRRVHADRSVDTLFDQLPPRGTGRKRLEGSDKRRLFVRHSRSAF
jgi:hypothetical protein